jgi:hypothetical protein
VGQTTIRRGVAFRALRLRGRLSLKACGHPGGYAATPLSARHSLELRQPRGSGTCVGPPGVASIHTLMLTNFYMSPTSRLKRGMRRSSESGCDQHQSPITLHAPPSGHGDSFGIFNPLRACKSDFSQYFITPSLNHSARPDSRTSTKRTVRSLAYQSPFTSCRRRLP